MSETVRERGQLLPVAYGKKQMKKYAKSKLKKLGCTEKEKYYDTWLEQLIDTHSTRDTGYMVIQDTLYSYSVNVLDVDLSFAEVDEDQSTGIIDFHVMYYNGGASLQDVLEDELKKQ
jgi:hypothetical protein